MDVFAWIDDEAVARERAGLVRTLRPRPAAADLLDLASNDYLGLSRHPETVRGAREAAETWGAGATGSRLVTGTTVTRELLRLHTEGGLGREALVECIRDGWRSAFLSAERADEALAEIDRLAAA